jgi:DNA topoisomerase-1
VSKPLVIVESPAKAKTIGKFLGAGYTVRASSGHVRDLPRSGMHVYPEDGFRADWEAIGERGKDKVIKDLRSFVAKTDTLYLATDPDREGEAIAWHLVELLLDSKKKKKDIEVRRVVFHEITKGAIQEAFDNAGDVHEDLVDAYKARRILDRLVGYQLSELLWKKLTRGLSAGRVQSVAVKLVVDREREIRAFDPEEYWRILANFGGDADSPDAFTAEFKRLNGEAHPLPNEQETNKILALVKDGPFTLSSLKQTPKKVNTKPPFKTSTLQQAASSRYGFTAKRTMRIAQGLYEGVELPGDGAVGLITYMRTDSFNIANVARDGARDLIGKRFGDKYVPEKPLAYKSKAGAQEAHEAIRPTDPARDPESIRKALTDEQWKLYDLIWRRFIASQMTPAEYLVTTLELTRNGALFTASGRVTIFDGFTRVWGADKDKADSQALPPLTEGQELLPSAITPTQHFTKPPRRYSEASLVKALEDAGIGRPSTYAAIISTIVDRKYVDHGEEAEQDMLRHELTNPDLAAKEKAEEEAQDAEADIGSDEEADMPARPRRKSAFHATHLGEVTTDLLEGPFSDIINTEFTARFESDLDEIAEGKQAWVDVVGAFYKRFVKDLEAAGSMDHYRANPLTAPDITCNKVTEEGGPECGAPMVVLFNRGGAYLGCSRYPDCSNNMPLSGQKAQQAELTEHTCRVKNDAGEVCGRQMERKVNRWGRPFLACTGYAEKLCKGAVSVSTKGEPLWPVETTVECPDCGRIMNIKRGRRGKFLACPGYPKCRGTLNLPSCTHKSRAGKECAATMTEPVAGGKLACREHPKVKLKPPPPRKKKGDEDDDSPAGAARKSTPKKAVKKKAAKKKTARKKAPAKPSPDA